MLISMSNSPARSAFDPRHKKFADHYLRTGKVSASAIHAGFSPKSAHVTGNRLLKRPDVLSYLQAQGNKVAKQEETLQAKVINEFAAMAFANIADFISIDDSGKPRVDFSSATPEQLKAIASVTAKSRSTYGKEGELVATEDTVGFAMADKYRGLEALGKHLGLFKADEQRVVVDVADRLLAARQRIRDAGVVDVEIENDEGGGGSTPV